MIMMDWYLGTMGFSYKDWQGALYPSGLDTRNFLSHYSRIFNAVEIDSSFYGTPRKATIHRWMAVTPAEFRFALKTPQTITHEGELVKSLPDMLGFLENARLLKDKLGAILLQFPPSFAQNQAERLAEFLAGLYDHDQLVRGARLAVEFRHPSWYTAAGDTASLLTRYGVCWAATEFPGLPREAPRTANFLYIRWIGQHGTYDHHTHVRQDRTPELTWWWAHLQSQLENVETIFGFFNNDYAGFAPGTCNLFKSISGIPATDFTPPQQPRLFDL